jgi:hypothetical protein
MKIRSRIPAAAGAGQYSRASNRCVALGIAGFSTLTGCTSMFTPLGSEYYDCNRKENPDSPYCHSFRSVEEGTAKPLPASRYDDPISIAALDQRVGIAPLADAASAPASPSTTPTPPSGARSGTATAMAGNSSPGAITHTALPQPAEGTPLRAAPLVVRTWVKRHVDGDDRLISATYVYKEILPAHWTGFEAAGPATARVALRPHWPASAPEGLASSGHALVKSIAGAAGTRPPMPGAPSAANTLSNAAGATGLEFPGFAQPGVQAPGGGSASPPPVDGGSMPQ